MKWRSFPDLVALGRLAAQPAALRALVLRDPAPICDALGLDKSKATSKREMRAMLKREFRAMEQRAQKEPSARSFDLIEEARPGPMTNEELANVLAGGTRKCRGG